jgi:erythronate-4-phosphate dehydrogenase
VDQGYLAKNGIKFISAPGSNANSVGEYIVAVLLELAHSKGFSLSGKTIGIVGVGNVGSNVWRKVEALGMHVLLNDPPLEQHASRYPLHPLDKLMESDIITLHVPLTRTGPNATYHLFDERQINKMKRGAILINTSRGAVVETDGLKRALLERHLSAAVLDVWEGEPHIDTSLLELVSIGTSHIAGYSLDGKVNALRIIFEAVCHFLSKSVDRSINALMPDPILPEISVGNDRTSKEQESVPSGEVLRDIVKQCYDICIDDRLLRKIVLLSEQDRKEYFSRLRANYRIRREFINRTVFVPNELRDSSLREINIVEVLGLLGFKVKS